MSSPPGPSFPSLDERIPGPAAPSYRLPLEEWDQMTDLAEHLSAMDAKSMVRRRTATYLEAKGRAISSRL